MEITVRLNGHTLPGRVFTDERPTPPVQYPNVHVGLQIGEAVPQPVPADLPRVMFETRFRIGPLPNTEGTNFLGPAAKGTSTERFFYLAWGVVGANGVFHGFRRAKIHLSHLPWKMVAEAAAAGQVLEVSLALTDRKGEPRCASVRPPDAAWRVVEAG